MPSTLESDTEELLRRAGRGERSAFSQLLGRYRPRLRHMVAVRMDARLAKRLDPSDVVQETLVEALRKIPVYLRDRPLPFYPWLRQIAWNRLIDLHRRHVIAKHRAVGREAPPDLPLGDRSAARLADRLVSRESAPSERLIRKEMRHRVQEAISRLPIPFREVLVLRHLELLSVADVAAVLGVAEGTVKSRHFRALVEMRRYLEEFD